MLTLSKTFITSFSLDYLVINWTIAPTIETIGDYEFSIFRSNSPKGKYKTVVTGLTDVFAYKDTSVALKNQWRKYWYKVRVTETATPANFIESDPFTQSAEPDAIALEIIRRNNILLDSDEFVGRSGYLLIRKTFGQRCVGCWDFVMHRKTRDDCQECFNTGFVGGYFEPCLIRMSINPESEAVRQAQFEIQPNQTAGWMSNYPLISPADIIIEDSNKRWRVVNVRKTEKRRVVLKQIFQLTAINKTDVEYRFPVPGEEDL